MSDAHEDYTTEERAGIRARWESFLSSEARDIDAADVSAASYDAGDWRSCAVGAQAEDRALVRALREHTHLAGEIRQAGGGDAEVYSDAPPLFRLGCAFESAIESIALAIDGDDERDDDAAETALGDARRLYLKIRAELRGLDSRTGRENS
jgi:hypothetical protein